MGAIRGNNKCCQFAASQARDGKAGGVGLVNMAGVMLRIVLIAMFFSVDISYVVKSKS